MSRNFRLLFCFFQFYCFLKEALTQNSVTKDDLGELYKAFVQDLVYIDREYKKLDSDAVLGLRVAEGKQSVGLGCCFIELLTGWTLLSHYLI